MTEPRTTLTASDEVQLADALRGILQEAKERLGVLDLDAKIREQGGDPSRIHPHGVGIFAGLWTWFMGLSLAARIFIGVLAVAGLMFAARMLQRPQFELDIPRTYGFNARRNTSGIGLPIPVIYGQHRIFPPIIQQYIEIISEVEYLNTLYAVSEGEIDLISAVEINEQPIERYLGVSWQSRLGTAVQTPIPWFQDTRNTYAVGVDLLDDGRTFTYRTVTRVDKFIVKVKVPPGGGAGSVGTSSVSFTIRVEHKRETDPAFTSLGDFVFTANTRKPRTFQVASGDLGLSSVKTAVTVANDAAIGGTAWTAPTNAQGIGDDLWATVNEPTATPRDTQYLRSSSHAMAVPTDATITGIQLEVERSHLPQGGSPPPDWQPWDHSTYDRSIRLCKAGSPVGDEKADTVTAWPLLDTVRVYGGTGDLWGTTWTPAEINASGFGAAVAARVDNGTCRVDALTLRVYYTSPSVLGLIRRDIRVTRVSTSTTDKPPMSFDSVDEIIYGSIANTYPNVAVLGVQIQASEQLNGEPKLSCVARGRKVRLLTNSVLGTTPTWSENPVECLIDVMTNTRYGLGRYITDADLVLSSFQAGKTYCDDFVGSERRHLLDVILDEHKPAGEWLELLLNTFRGFLVEGNGQYRLVVDHLTPVSQVFTDANIIRSSLQTSWVSLSEEYDQVEVFYLDRDNYWLRDSIKFPATGTKTKAIHLYGITRRTHAEREAHYHYNVISLLSRFVEFDCALEALAVEVGDVIQVSHRLPKWGFGGRVMAVATADAGVNHLITVDRDDLPTTGLTAYVFAIRQTDDLIETKTTLLSVSAPYTTAEGYPRQDVKVQGLFAQAPTVRDAGWIFGPTAEIAKPFRVLDLSLNEDKTRHVRAFEYNPTTFETGVTGAPAVLFRAFSSYTDIASDVLARTANSVVWEAAPTAPFAGDFWFKEADGATGLVVRGNGEIRKTLDGGTTWTALTTCPAGASGGGIILADGTILVGATILTDLKIYRSTDAGVTWSTVTVAAGRTNCTPQQLTAAFWQTALGTVLFMDYRFNAIGDKPRVYRSIDGGVTWTMVLEPDVTATGAAWVHGSLTYYNGTCFAIADSTIGTTTCRMYRSIDDGVTWAEVFSHSTRRLKSYDYRTNPAPCPGLPGQWVLATDANQYRSTDDGVTWVDETSRGIKWPIWSNNEAMFAAKGTLPGSGGLAVSLDGGLTWQVYNLTFGSIPRDIYRAPGIVG